jgi:hypothetical protein
MLLVSRNIYPPILTRGETLPKIELPGDMLSSLSLILYNTRRISAIWKMQYGALLCFVPAIPNLDGLYISNSFRLGESDV